QRRQLVAARRAKLAQLYLEFAPARGGDLRRRLRRPLHGVPFQIFDVRVPGGVAPLNAYTESHRNAARGGLENAFVENERATGAVFEEQIRVIAPARERDREEPRANCG